ncbi:hypothetical protein JXD38_12570, partial [candidate division WOR-3 bacterium]|nr:hypothetical protein [candidate division WOR-3 bacterium]
ATNLSNPKISVITRIGYDHLKVLGNTLTKIAGEKAGIMRKGRPVVIGDQKPEARRELEARARAIGAELVPADSVAEIPSVDPRCWGMALSPVAIFGAELIDLPLLGYHQVENCKTALAVLNELSWCDRRIKINRVARGMRTVSIPARCQIVRQQPLTIVDSCHNPESGRALANLLRDHVPRLRAASCRFPHPRPLPEGEGRGEGGQLPKVILVYGSLGGKLVEETVAPLAPFVQQAVLVQPDSPRAMPLSELGRVFSKLGIPHVTAEGIRDALAEAKKLARDSSLPVVVAGSFYLAGEVIKVLGPSRARLR